MALNKEAKPCPKCAASISKIDGCDQMWCTQCRTAFSWRTGAIETAVHNPHYYEWKRRNGGLEPAPVGINLVGMAGDGLACIEPHIIIEACIGRTTTIAGFAEACRMILHARRVIIPSLRQVQRTGEESRRVLRVRRLAGEISEAEWTNLLHSQDAKERKSVRITQVIELYCNAGIDILRAMAGGDEDQNDKHAGELIKLRDYCQQSLLKIKKRFGPVPSLI
jgi:hypothetical protein